MGGMNRQAISTDSSLQSLNDYGGYDFPMRLYLDDFRSLPLGHINWHWHKQLEFSCVLRGEIEYSVGEAKIRLGQGEGVFINAGRLHAIRPAAGHENAMAFSLVFSPAILSYGVESIVYQKYVLPVAQDRRLHCLTLRQDIPWQREMLALLAQLYGLFQERPYGFELSAQSLLVQAWREMVLHLNRNTAEKGGAGDASEERLKRMISCIQANFSEALTLQQIASAASVSKSECIRCFKKRLGVTPVEYLIEYRLSKVMEYLDGTDLPVAEIGQRCGFESASYFAKTFRRRTGLSPSGYRKRRASG